MAARTGDSEACCLVWCLTEFSHTWATEAQLLSLHEEIRFCAELVDASIAEENATSGMLMCVVPDVVTTSSSEDSIVRIGQLLCRWASMQVPALGLQIGVHTGSLRKLVMPRSGQEGFFGDALSTARMLALNSSRETCVHLSKNVKDRLCMLEQLTFSCSSSSRESYYLEPWTRVEGRDDNRVRVSTTLTSVYGPVVESSSAVEPTMSFDEFRETLTEHGVDIWKFGRGHAKTLAQFYKSVFVHKKSQLIVTDDGKLEHHMELVRIILRADSPTDGCSRQLRLASEIMEDGRAMQRNLKPAIKVPEDSNWRNAVWGLFRQRFGLAQDVLEDALILDEDSHTYKEERMTSLSTPGIMTTYKIHEVCVRVAHLDRDGLELLGLPKMRTFSTPADPANGIPKSNWSWLSLDKASGEVDALVDLLESHGINVAEFTPAALADLNDEVFHAKYATLTVQRNGDHDELERNISIMKVWICADILSIEQVLVYRWDLKGGKFDYKTNIRTVSSRMLQDQCWQDAVSHALLQKLGLDEEFQKKHVSLDERSYRLSEEIAYSRTYPGLRTVYSIHEVKCHILDPTATGMERLGLPEGSDCTVTRFKEGEDGSEMMMTGWCWKPLMDVQGSQSTFQRSMLDQPLSMEAAASIKRKLPVPSPLRVPVGEQDGSSILELLMRGKRTNWDRARNAAKRIRDKNYTCRHFFEDCTAAFPELSLYVIATDGDAKHGTTSGRSGEDEYQRTMGSLFVVYWIMRIYTDGAQSFCFGVDEDWNPLTVSSTMPVRSTEELAKRQEFMRQMQWDKITDLAVDAGLLKGDSKNPHSITHDVERTLAMLVLTAIHDIMKVQMLTPVVDAKHCEEWCGYKPGEKIGDHDAALGYVLEYLPDVLPSYSMLSRAQRQSLKFTQCKMEYNMGWLVQAEAPPGALFSKFKTVIRSGQASSLDVSFYFVHWLTDLAAAEPFPQEGCEKFVLKFPQKVLASFLNSFSIVQQLSVRSETEVLEDYLVWRWTDNRMGTRRAPSGPGSIARLRIVMMSQGDTESVLRAYEQLHSDDMAVLDDELARTGCKDQSFVREAGSLNSERGPAILVYYAPALMQKAGATDPCGALTVLADVFRQARALFPLDAGHASDTVVVRIDALKELHVSDIRHPDGPCCAWMLQRLNSRDAQVRRVGVEELQTSGFSWATHRSLFTSSIGARRPVFQRRKAVASAPVVRLRGSSDTVQPAAPVSSFSRRISAA